MKTKHEVLDDVVKHIKKQGGRATNEKGFCQYIGDKGKVCGHSMALKPSIRKEVQHRVGSYDRDSPKYLQNSAAGIILEFGDKCHQKKYQGHEIEFWGNVQGLHDGHGHWTTTGEITRKGELHLEKLKRKWA